MRSYCNDRPTVDTHCFGKSVSNGFSPSNYPRSMNSIASQELLKHTCLFIGDHDDDPLEAPSSSLICFTGEDFTSKSTTSTNSSTSFLDSNNSVSLSKDVTTSFNDCQSPFNVESPIKLSPHNAGKSSPNIVRSSPNKAFVAHNERTSSILKSSTTKSAHQNNDSGKSLGKPPPYTIAESICYQIPQQLPFAPFDTTTTTTYECFSDMGETNITEFKNRRNPLFPELLMRVDSEIRGVDDTHVFNKPNVFDIFNLPEFEEEEVIGETRVDDGCKVNGENRHIPPLSLVSTMDKCGLM